MRLEAAIKKGCTDRYDFGFRDGVASFNPFIRQLISEKIEGKPTNLLASKFHNTIVEVVLQTGLSAQKESGHQSVFLSGGTFQNKYLAEIKSLSQFHIHMIMIIITRMAKRKRLLLGLTWKPARNMPYR